MEFTSQHKAWAAAVMAVLGILDVHFGWHFAGLSEEVILVIIGVIGTIVVFLLPNAA